jgi:hypothetical protein
MADNDDHDDTAPDPADVEVTCAGGVELPRIGATNGD